MTALSPITVQATIEAPIERTWDLWTGPEHIMQWNNASDDWHTPHAENDPRTGGKFLSRMEANPPTDSKPKPPKEDPKTPPKQDPHPTQA